MNILAKLPEREKNPETCCPSVKEGKVYINPWPSVNKNKISHSFKLLNKVLFGNLRSVTRTEKNEELKVELDLEAINKFSEKEDMAIQLIWLGHAAFLLQINKFNILFDPLLTKSASPLSFIGPYRCRDRGFKSFSELPVIDFICISHNHYDHLDKNTIKEIYKEPKNSKTQIFCPLGLKKWFISIGVSENLINECDWWDDYEVCRLTKEEEEEVKQQQQQTTNNTSNEITITPSQSKSSQKITISSVPCQHFSGRSLSDRDTTLWTGWVVKSKDASYYFSGDTGYRSLPDNYDPEKIDDYPYCPVFKQIGNIHGPFDLASLPIGPVEPPAMMSPIHATPLDAINIHLDSKSKHSIAMHWGTVEYLGIDKINSGPEELHKQMEKKKIPLEQFHEVYIGQAISIKKSDTIANSKN